MIGRTIATIAISIVIATPASAAEWRLYNRAQNRCEIGQGAFRSPGAWADSLRAQGRKSQTDITDSTVSAGENLGKTLADLGREMSNPEETQQNFERLIQPEIVFVTVQADDTGEYHEWMHPHWCAWFSNRRAREQQELH